MGPLGHSGAALLALLGLPVGLAALALRPALAQGLGERLGAHPGRGRDRPWWLHGASLGEARAALRLADALAAAGEPVVASTVTTTGRALLREARPELATGLAPLDHPWAVRRALARVAPRALVLIETELWPAWIAAAAERGVPVAVVSARISDRSLPRYLRLARLWAPTFRRLGAVGARGAEDAARFAQLGVPEARIAVTGDLKLEGDAAAGTPAPQLAAALAGVPLLVAGSTREGEEGAALGALAALLARGAEAALVLAPRHPQRFAAAADAVREAGRPLRIRSQLAARPGPLASGEVLLLDSLGELGGAYARARLAFVGGTLAPVGGHNLLEPVQAGVPVVYGPHLENQREAAALLAGCGAGSQVDDAAGLAARAVEAWQAPERWAARGAAGREALRAHRGATERTVALLRGLIASAGGAG